MAARFALTQLSRPRLAHWAGVQCDTHGCVTVLELSDNNMEGTLRGTVEMALACLPHLTQLWLSGNRLSGPLPASLASLPKLEILDVGGNSLRGALEQLSLMVMQTGIGLTRSDTIAYAAGVIDVIVQLGRDASGKRGITAIADSQSLI